MMEEKTSQREEDGKTTPADFTRITGGTCCLLANCTERRILWQAGSCLALREGKATVYTTCPQYSTWWWLTITIVIIRASYISHTGGRRWTSLQHKRTICFLWSSIFTIMMYLWGWTHWLISGLMLFCMHCMQIALISSTFTLARVHEEDLSIIFLTGH